MRIAILDDERAELDALSSMIRARHPESVIEAFTSGEKLLSAAKQAPGYGVAFLDIYMDGENGVDIARALAEIRPGTFLVFVTTSREHAVEAFSLSALHYLVKPVTPEALEEVFARIDARARKKRPMLVLQSGQAQRAYDQDEIRYLQSADHATEILLADGSVCRARLSLAELMKQLDGRFIRIQRGLIVNMNCIRQMNADDCVMRDGVTFLLSRKDKFAIRAAYNDYVFGQLSKRGAQESEDLP